MGVYYAVVNHTRKEYIYDPAERGVKWYTLFDYECPMARLVLYQIYDGWAFDKISIVSDHDAFPWWEEEGWKDITQKAVEEYISVFGKRETHGFKEADIIKCKCKVEDE